MKTIFALLFGILIGWISYPLCDTNKIFYKIGIAVKDIRNFWVSPD